MEKQDQPCCPEAPERSLIDVIVADDQELFRAGMMEILEAAADLRVVGQPASTEQLLSALGASTPHILVLSTGFLLMFDNIQRLLTQLQTALVVLAEDNDKVAYGHWLQARAVLRRSMDGPAVVDAMRRVVLAELLPNDDRSNITRDLSKTRPWQPDSHRV